MNQINKAINRAIIASITMLSANILRIKFISARLNGEINYTGSVYFPASLQNTHEHQQQRAAAEVLCVALVVVTV